jgi:hypothetical protein
MMFKRPRPHLVSPLVLSAVALCLLTVATACGPEGDDADQPDQLSSWFDEPAQELPQQLSGFGLFPSPDNLDQVPDGALYYEPAYPLWSNGSSKYRHVVLPDGASIDTSAATWQFPTGTLIFKTFAYATGSSEAGSPLTPVETRVLRRLEDRWEYAVYLWNESGQDATQLDLLRPVDVPVTMADGTSFVHEVPNKLQCRSCHEAGADLVLGINARQFSDGPESQVADWHEKGYVSTLPQAPAPLEGDELTRWVKGYALGNCVHCHNDGDAANSSYSLYPEDFVANTVNQPTEGNASVAGTRVVPGEPEESVLYLAVRGDEDNQELKAMPPEGVQVRDDEALAQIRAWIESLEGI